MPDPALASMLPSQRIANIETLSPEIIRAVQASLNSQKTGLVGAKLTATLIDNLQSLKRILQSLRK
jgi:hypothetical protein